ncbi:hypothetical protein CHARACLAT_017430, partial [Characodon lateralis]|nr:hypothetical protein [Characodon lateralis]
PVQIRGLRWLAPIFRLAVDSGRRWGDTAQACYRENRERIYFFPRYLVLARHW